MDWSLPTGDVCKSTDELGTYVSALLCLLLPCVIYRQKAEEVRYSLVFSWFFFVLVANHLYIGYFPTQIGDNKKIKDGFWFAPMALATFPLCIGAVKAVLLELLFFFGVAFCFWDVVMPTINIAAAVAIGLGMFGITYLIPQLRHLAMKVWMSVVLTVSYVVLIVSITATDTRECGSRRNLMLLCSANCTVITREYHFESLPLAYAIGSYMAVFGSVTLVIRKCCTNKEKKKKKKPKRRSDGYEETPNSPAPPPTRIARRQPETEMTESPSGHRRLPTEDTDTDEDVESD
jgi:hypothetical protein